MNKSKTFINTTSALLLGAALFVPGINYANPEKPVNLNTVDAKTLAKSIKGIGPKRAEAIIAYRDKQGEFKTLDDLALVDGITTEFLRKNRAELESAFSIK